LALPNRHNILIFLLHFGAIINPINKGVKMKNIWKWILGVLLVLVVVAALAAAAFAWRTHMGVAFINGGAPFARGWDTGPMMRGNDGWNAGPMMGGRGGFGFLGPIVFIGGLLKLVFFAALLYGAYWLGKRNARVVLGPRPAALAPKENA